MIVTEAFGGEKGKAAASSYSLAEPGHLEPVSESIADTRSEVCWAATTKDGRFVFVTNFGDGTISSYAIGNGGALELLEPVAGSTVIGEPGNPRRGDHAATAASCTRSTPTPSASSAGRSATTAISTRRRVRGRARDGRRNRGELMETIRRSLATPTMRGVPAWPARPFRFDRGLLARLPRQAARRPARPGAAGPVPDRRLPGALGRARRRTRRSTSGRSRSTARSTSRVAGRWDEFRALPSETVTRRHPLRDEVVEARHRLGGRLASTRCSTASSTTPSYVRRVLRRRLHDEPAARGRDRRQGVGRVRLRRRAARPRARRPGAAARPAPLLLEERQVGARPASCATRTSPASGRRYGYHNYGDPWREQRYCGRLTWQRRRGRRARRRRRRGCGRIALDVPDWPGHRAGPARRRPADRRGRLPGAAQLLDRLGARGRAASRSRSSGSTTARSRRTSIDELRRRRQARAARPDRRLLRLGRRRAAGRCCWSPAARASCR